MNRESVLQDLTPEQLGSMVLRISEKPLGLVTLDDLPAIHENY